MNSRSRRSQGAFRSLAGRAIPRALTSVLAAFWLGSAAGSLRAGAPGAESTARLPLKEQAYYLYSLSQQAQFQRNYVDALKFLEQAVQSDDCADLRVELADLYSSLNQTGEAEEQARRALQHEPGNVGGRRLLAQVLVRDLSAGAARNERLAEAEGIYRGLVQDGNADVESVLALTNLQMGRGDAAGARATLEGYRSSHAASSVIDLELARVLQQSGHPEEAISILREVVGREKENREARNTLGNFLEDAGLFEDAAQVYRGLVEENPGSSYGHYRLAMALLSLEKYDEAQEHLRIALSAEPGNAHVLLGLGQAYEGAHDLRLAEGSYRQALQRDPTSMEARFFLARVLQDRGEEVEALALYGEILSKNQGRESSQEKAYYTLAATQAGVIRLLQKDHPAALASLTEAFESSENPGGRLYLLLGRAYLESGMSEQAEKILREGLAKFPEDPELAAAEGMTLLRNSKPEEARKRFRDLVERAQGVEGAYREVIQACLEAERPKEAEPWSREALEKHPHSRDLEFQAAALDERLGRFRQAERKLRELIGRHPNDADALNYLGYMLADRGTKLEDALRMLEKAVELEPENIAYLDSLGWVHYRLGHFDQAEVILLQAARGSRVDPTILDHLGDVRFALGKSNEALEAYRAALEQGPEKPDDVRRKIQKLEKSLDRP